MNSPSSKDFGTTMRIDLLDDSQPAFTPIPAKEPAASTPQSSPYRELLQSIYDGALIADLNGIIKEANSRAASFLHTEQEQLIGKSVKDIIVGIDDAMLQQIRQELKAEHFILLQANCMRLDQTHFPAEISANFLQIDSLRICFFIRDVTLRKQQEAELRIGSMAIHNAGNGIAICDPEGIISQANPAWAQLWGYSEPDEVQGVNFADLFVNNASLKNMLQVVFEGADTWKGELEAQHKNEYVFPAQVSTACNYDAKGTLIGLVISADDVSERKRIQDALHEKAQALEKDLKQQTERLIQADRLATLGTLVAGIAHEINNPNTFIASNMATFKVMWEIAEPFLQTFLQNEEEVDSRLQLVLEEMPALIGGIQEGTTRIETIIKEMKQFAAGNRIPFRRIEPQQVIHTALVFSRKNIESEGIKLTVDLPADMPAIYGSETLLSQVFINLLLNALNSLLPQPTNRQGHITITGETVAADHILLKVADNGPGIPSANLTRLFDPFFSTRRKTTGTGLGLFVCQTIITGHGGKIMVQSQEGENTTFTIELPCIQEEEPQALTE